MVEVSRGRYGLRREFQVFPAYPRLIRLTMALAYIREGLPGVGNLRAIVDELFSKNANYIPY